MPVKDAAAMRYETLRGEYLTGKAHHTDEFRARFFALGFVGLLPPEAPSDYIVEVYQAPSRGWWGRIDSQEQALLEAFRLLSGPATLAPPNPGVHRDERCPVRTSLDEEPGETWNHRFAARCPSQLRERARF